jgi:hypothetical protein
MKKNNIRKDKKRKECLISVENKSDKKEEKRKRVK